MKTFLKTSTRSSVISKKAKGCRQASFRHLPLNFLALLIFIALISGCSTAPVDYSKYESGKWEAKVLVKNTRSHKSHILEFDILAVKPHQVRMEITTPMGFHMASFVLNEKEVAYALTKQKKFYRGRPTRNSMKPLLSVRLDPKLLMSFLFDIEPSQKNWKCEKDSKGFLKSCQNKRLKMNVEWKNRERYKKTVFVSAPKVKMQMNFRDFEKATNFSDKTFVLKPPKSFKVYKIVR